MCATYNWQNKSNKGNRCNTCNSSLVLSRLQSDISGETVATSETYAIVATGMTNVTTVMMLQLHLLHQLNC